MCTTGKICGIMNIGNKTNKHSEGLEMKKIYILTVSDEENFDNWYFTTHEKAANFIKDNFNFDNPRRLTDTLYQGKKKDYVISEQAVDQGRI